MRSANRATLRLDEAALEAILEKLDHTGHGDARMVRRTKRYAYRVKALIELTQGEEQIRESVPCRNISREGVGFLIGRFVYPGTRCRVRLVSEFNQSHMVEGLVVRCRYIEGTPGVHEAGVEFDNPIDIAMFHRGASQTRVLLVDNDAMQTRMLMGILAKHNAEVVVVKTPDEAQSIAMADPFDLILVNFDSEQIAGCQLCANLRQRGYVRPLTAISTLGITDVKSKCDERKCASCVPATLDPKSLALVLQKLANEPVVSTLAHDPDAAALINPFVFSLQEQITALESACSASDWEKMASASRRLGVFASGSGFEMIADATKALIEVTSPPGDVPEIRERLNTLVRLCLAARPTSATDSRLDSGRALPISPSQQR